MYFKSNMFMGIDHKETATIDHTGDNLVRKAFCDNDTWLHNKALVYLLYK